jgi:hypothetical protein
LEAGFFSDHICHVGEIEAVIQKSGSAGRIFAETSSDKSSFICNDSAAKIACDCIYKVD